MAKKKKTNPKKKTVNITNDVMAAPEAAPPSSSDPPSPVLEDAVTDAAAEEKESTTAPPSPEQPAEAQTSDSEKQHVKPLEESPQVPVQLSSSVNAEQEGLTTTNGTAVSPLEGTIERSDIPESTSTDLPTKALDEAGATVVGVEDKTNVNTESSVAAGEHPVGETTVDAGEVKGAPVKGQPEVLEDKESQIEAVDNASDEVRTAGGSDTVAIPPASVEPSATKESFEKEEQPVDERLKEALNETVEPYESGSVIALSNDVLPTERGIDDSPSDELGPPARVEDVKTDITGHQEEPASKHDLPLEFQGFDTKPSEASTVILANVATSKKAIQKSSVVDNKEVSFETAEEEKKVEKPVSDAPRLSFAQAFGSSANKPPPIQTDMKENGSTYDPTPRGMTFAQAFGNNAATPVSPLATPASVSKDASSDTKEHFEPLHSTKSSSSSHSALSASKNKKVQGLMSKYMEGVAHEPLPGDAIPIRKKSMEESPAHSASYASQDTPLSAQSIREKLAVTEVELSQLPKITSVRDKFETSSRSTGSDPVFEFGESFRQKKRFEQLSDKQRQEEARVAMHGFNERDLYPGKVASGEIDTSSLSKVYTFEMTANASMDLPPDGTCRIDYKKADYTSMVFVVHRTRGMLLLHVGDGVDRKSQVPNGMIEETEFLAAAQKSGSGNVQLQIAAREAAARQLFENTGLDIRGNVDRFKPAILRLNPPVDAKGVRYLKNEYNNRLYYFLQVDENDFTSISKAAGKLTRPSEDPGDGTLALRLRNSYDGFTFVLDPSDAAKILKDEGNKEATSALRMIMNEASEDISTKGPDAKATEYSVGDSAPDDEKADRLASATIRTVGEKSAGKPSSGEGLPSFHDEAALNIKSSSDTHDHTDGVSCCCGWW